MPGMELFPSVSEIDRPTATIALVAGGGITGACGRWSIAGVLETDIGTWPWGTFVVNVVGCLAIGFAARRVDRGSASWSFLVTGVLGGFTTMSAFAVELNDLVEADRTVMAWAYGVTTLAVGIAAMLLAGRVDRSIGPDRLGATSGTVPGGSRGDGEADR